MLLLYVFFAAVVVVVVAVVVIVVVCAVNRIHVAKINRARRVFPAVTRLTVYRRLSVLDKASLPHLGSLADVWLGSGMSELAKNIKIW